MANEINGTVCEPIDSQTIAHMKEPNIEKIANNFVQYFDSAVEETIHSCKVVLNPKEVRLNISNSIGVTKATEEEIYMILLSMKGNKGAGSDGIRPIRPL